ncbi:hypothetical protein LO772_02200 [Yinghuangia sp. ASG 101]|uniref:DUF4286 family protein n=1 Tax=Yinghuangia sp. ASG 101 TaxID=2896848 RepID=UPI001E3593BF|nr:DUF4286 family protein [Yinghuangia sp. ASG 101]UGQ12448.1 hypothetical protein LO772_02200 [Yinghuangia sp. ASG 101]
MARGVMIVESGPVSREREDEYNAWYTGTHIPELLAVPGFVAARRYRLRRRDGVDADPELPVYLAVYELEADDLTEPQAELARRRADGRAGTPSGALRREPPPVVSLFELDE